MTRMRQFEREVHATEWAIRSAKVFFGSLTKTETAEEPAANASVE